MWTSGRVTERTNGPVSHPPCRVADTHGIDVGSALIYPQDTSVPLSWAGIGSAAMSVAVSPPNVTDHGPVRRDRSVDERQGGAARHRHHPAQRARVYDYFLGGKDNFAVDRQVAEMALQVTPDGPEAGGPTGPSCAERCATWSPRPASASSSTSAPACPPRATCTRSRSRSDPDARVVYVDNDPMVLAHGRALLADARHRHGDPGATCGSRRRSSTTPRCASSSTSTSRSGCCSFGDPAPPRATTRTPTRWRRVCSTPLPSGSYLAHLALLRPGRGAARRPPRRRREVEKVFNEYAGHRPVAYPTRRS